MKSGLRFGMSAASFSFVILFVFAFAGCGSSSGGSANVVTPGPADVNSVPVTVGFGPNGQSGGLINGIFTSITVCQQGTSNCAAVGNVLVDTGSVGLRLLPSALGSVTLGQILSGTSAVEECIQYGDTSYSWGPMEVADVTIGGETASGIPVQVLGATGYPVPANCLSTPVDPNLPNGGNNSTLEALGANGILGIGGAIWDCGSYCTSNTSGNPYYACPNGVCAQILVPTTAQATNPVAAFSSSDSNGVVITLPSVDPTGAVTVSGTLTFGIGTQADNALPNTATLFAMDPCGNFPTVTYHGVPYTDTFCTQNGSAYGGFVDTGSGAMEGSDAGTLGFLGITDCASGTSGYGFYCVPGGTATLSDIVLVGNAGLGSGTTSLNINDATALIDTNNAVFNNLGTDSGTSPQTDFFDFGLPWFLGRTVFVGIAGTAVPNGVSAPYGFVAF